jgi:hypothetical protein
MLPILEHKAAAFIAADLAPSIRQFARAVYPDTCSFIALEPGLLEHEIVEFVTASASAGKPKIFGELVRIHFNDSRDTAATLALRDQLRLLIGPHIEGVGKVRTDDTPEGVVIVALD